MSVGRLDVDSFVEQAFCGAGASAMESGTFSVSQPLDNGQLIFV